MNHHPDEDIKIYEGAREEPAFSGAGEAAAAEYVAHRENGNLAKTHQLGELLAETLVGDARRLRQESCCHQKLVLLSYLAKDELRRGLHSPILQRSAVSAMERRLEDVSPEIYDVVTDSTAFTLYILNGRQGDGRSTGEILAQICDRDGDPPLVARGNQLEAEYRKLFGGIIASYTLREIP